MSRGHRRRGAAAHADAHALAAQLNQQGARGKCDFVDVCVRHGADATRDHDRLVIAVHVVADALLERAEISAQIGATKFVVKRRATNRALNHDVERRRNAIRFADVGGRHFPRLRQARQAQVRCGESGNARLRRRAAPSSALVANLAARARRSACERRDGGWVVVGLDLGQIVREIGVRRVLTLGIRVKALGRAARENRCVVRVSDLGACWR